MGFSSRKNIGSAVAFGVCNIIDERLCCDWHEKEIRERLRSLE